MDSALGIKRNGMIPEEVVTTICTSIPLIVFILNIRNI